MLNNWADYEAFAAEHSEDLARAIEQGIPDTLRGMMWQLMCASAVFVLIQSDSHSPRQVYGKRYRTGSEIPQASEGVEYT